jgi:hypothetical protein
MNAFRKASVVVLVMLVAVIALGVFESSAQAGGGCYNYGGGYKCYTPSYTNYSSCYGNSCYYPTSCYDYSCYYPTYQVAKPINYPVTQYDCYGRPYVTWQTNYTQNPLW